MKPGSTIFPRASTYAVDEESVDVPSVYWDWQLGGGTHPDDLLSFQNQRAVSNLLALCVHRYKAVGIR